MDLRAFSQRTVPRDELEITIEPTGDVTLRTIGVLGSRCLDLAGLMAEIVGRQVSCRLTADHDARCESVRLDNRIGRREPAE